MTAKFDFRIINSINATFQIKNTTMEFGCGLKPKYQEWKVPRVVLLGNNLSV